MPTPSSNGPSGAGAAGAAGAKDNKTLPPKENALFKRILKCYEQKQYKNGLKFAKQILSNPKFVDHGETLAMKGLTLNCLGRKEEAYDHVRRGLRNDLKSHVCWHVYGLLQRSDKKYDEAIKCYRNALKWDKDNIQILRDLSLLQIQMRDLEGYKETRYQLFQLRPTQRASWIGFAMSYHLLDDHDMALKILEEFRKTQQGVNREVVGQVMQALYNKKAAYDYEHSELLLYQNMVIQESGNAAAALEHLHKYKDQICDKTTFLETQGILLMKLDRHDEAVPIFTDLVRRNPENHAHYRLLETSRKLNSEEERLAFYAEMANTYPRAQAPRRIPLAVARGDDFRRLVDRYLRKALTKGVPPLFVDLKPLYEDEEKVGIIEELIQSYLDNLRGPSGSYDAPTAETPAPPREPVTAFLWTMYYAVQHHDHLGRYPKALTMVEEAIEHTPTLIELYLLKGKIFKHVGDLEEAVKCLDEAQSLDTADRYINCKCAKYMLRAGQVAKAEEICGRFTREGAPPADNLNEMQCMWFQTECARAHANADRPGEAIKKCIEVDRHFTEIIEDQFDFHTYCMRKMTLRSYVDLLRLEDVLRSHRFYERAAHVAINTYIGLHDHPVEDKGDLGDVDADNMDPAELKKLRNKQKKAKRKAEQERQQQQQLQAKKELHNKSQKKGSGGGGDEELDAPTKDELLPEKLERPEDPLAEALKFLRPLQTLASKRPTTHVLAFEIHWRRRKPLLMLQCIKRLLRADPEFLDPRSHSCLVRFQKFMEDGGAGLPEAVRTVVERETAAALEATASASASAAERNAKFLSDHPTSLPHVFEGAKMLHHLEPGRAQEAVKLVANLDSFAKGVDLKTCSNIYEALLKGELGGATGKEAAESFRQTCKAKFPMATQFRPEEEKKTAAAAAARAAAESAAHQEEEDGEQNHLQSEA